MGYDGLFLGRIDFEDKINRLIKKTGEMVWKASDSLGSKAELFTGALYNTYSPPPGFCFDILCADEPIVDDKNSPEYNVDRRVIELLFTFILLFTQYYYYYSFELILIARYSKYSEFGLRNNS